MPNRNESLHLSIQEEAESCIFRQPSKKVVTGTVRTPFDENQRRTLPEYVFTKMKHAITKFKGYYQKQGALGALKFVGRRLVRKQIHVVYEADATEKRSPSAWGEDESVIMVNKDNIGSFDDQNLRTLLGPDSASEYIESVHRGDLMFLATWRGQYVHMSFVLFNNKTNKVLGVPSDLPLLANWLTIPDARGRAILKRILNDELMLLGEMGYKRVWAETHPENIPSRRAQEAVGFRLKGDARVIVLANVLALQKLNFGSTRYRVSLLF